MDDLMGDFLGRAHFSVHQHIGLAIESFSLGEEFADLRLRILGLEQWAVGLMSHAIPDHLRGGPKADHQRMALQTFKELSPSWQSTSSGNDQRLTAGKFSNRNSLPFSKDLLSLFGEDPRDGLPGLPLDPIVRVEKVKTELHRCESSHGRLPHAHKANQRQIPYGSVRSHASPESILREGVSQGMTGQQRNRGLAIRPEAVR